MKLNLTKPLVVFDLETTGLDLVKDRIIQISYIKVNVDQTEIRVNQYVPMPMWLASLPSRSWLPLWQRRSEVVTLPVSTVIISTFLCWQKSFCVLVWTLISPKVD